MTVQYKRKALSRYCCATACSDCAINHRFPQHKCGRGYIFFTENQYCFHHLVPEDEVIMIYDDLLHRNELDSNQEGDAEMTTSTTTNIINAQDNVNHPDHYTRGGIECIDAIEAAVTGLTGPEAVLTGQCIKYLWRWKWKNGAEDLRKAEFYLKRLIKTVKDGETSAEQ